MLTIIAAVLVLVDPHINHHVTLFSFASVHLCESVCNGSPDRVRTGKERERWVQVEIALRSSQWKRKGQREKIQLPWTRNSNGLEPNDPEQVC